MAPALEAVPAGAATDVVEYPLSTVGAHPRGITAGPDGNLWFTEYAGNKIGRITPAGVVTEFPLPTANAGPQFITAGPDGNVWFSEYDANKIGRLKLSDSSITEFDVPTDGAGPYGITAGPDGNVWFAEANFAGKQIGKITPAGEVSEYSTSVFCPPPMDVAFGPDGNLWFTVQGCGRFGGGIGRMTTAGVVTFTKSTQVDGDPIGIVAGPDGAMWFAENTASAVGRITMDGQLTEYPTPTRDSFPVDIAMGADGNLWFTESGASQVGRISPEGFIDEFAIPTAGSDAYGISSGPDGRIWFTEHLTEKVGAIVTTATSRPSLHIIEPDEGASTGGTNVVITGASLTGATGVKFGNVPATSFTADSDTQVTAVAPPLAGNYYDVTVETPAGATLPVPRGRYASLAPLKVSGLSPREDDPDGGLRITVFGSGFTTATAVNFGGTPAVDFGINSDTQITATVPPQPDHTVIHVLVTNVAGTSPATSADLFTYLARPMIDFVAPKWGPAAGGTPVTITGRRFTGATAVNFGDQAVKCPDRCQVVSDDVIEALSPPGAVGAVPISVTTPDHGISLQSPLFAFTSDGAYVPTGPCAPACASAGAVLLPNGKVLGIGGDFGTMRANLYDPLTGTWTPKSECPFDSNCRNFGGSAVLLPSGPPSVCGSNCGKVLLQANGKLYDPATDTWSQTSPPPFFGFFNDPVLLGNGKVLAVNALTATVYDPAADTWTPTGPLQFRHNSAPVILLDNGKVLVVGGGGAGQSGSPPRIFAGELYDPATNNWSPAGQTAVGRLAHAAVKMANGKVLITGGTINFTKATPIAEQYDPVTGEWSPFESTIFARNSHTANLLPDGRVLLSGGDEPFTSCGFCPDLAGNTPSIGEVYDPATAKWTPAGPSISLQDRRQNNQQNTIRTVVLPPGPVAACGTHCGQVLTVRGHDIGALEISLVPSAALYAPSPRATLAPASGTTAGGTAVTLTGTGLASVSAVSFGGVPAASVTPDPTTPDTKVTVVTPARIAGAVDVAVTTEGGVTIAGRFTFQTPPAPPAASSTPAASPQISVLPSLIQAPTPAGYAMAAADGGVFSFGSLPFAGSLGGARPNQPIAAIEHTPSGKGYWLVGADGAVFAFGDAAFKGSTGGIRLSKPIVDIVGTPSGNGYFLIGSDGGVFAFGDAAFKGSTGALKLNLPIVAAERSKTGNGYWLIGADGGVFAFGDAAFKGSTGALRLAQPVVSVTRSAAGAGYWLIASDGGVFAFGDAVFHGSTGAIKLNSPIVGAAASATGSGYVLCAKDGGAFAFGAAGFVGSLGATRLESPITSCSGPRPAA